MIIYWHGGAVVIQPETTVEASALEYLGSTLKLGTLEKAPARVRKILNQQLPTDSKASAMIGD